MDSAQTSPPQTNAAPTSYVDSYSPPAVTPPPTTTPSEATPSQTLEDQNIFHLLGIEAAKDEEKEAFLDELQQVIWEDFLENDISLLITEEEMVEFKKIGESMTMTEEDKQVEMVEFLEKLIPDLEKIMLEKALELKEEMTRERIKEYLGVYQTKPEVLQKVQTAKTLADNQQWRAAADLLNSL